MRNKALLTVEQYQMLPAGSRVTVALSGGADSVALLHFLCSLRQEHRLTIKACHINHLLRGEESERDEAFVRKLCRKWQVPLRVFREDVAAGAKNAGESDGAVWPTECVTAAFSRRQTAVWLPRRTR